MTALVLSIFLAGLVTWFIIKPFLVADSQSIGASGQLVSLQIQKNRCLELLRDLETDYAASLLEESDYEQTRQRLTAELGGILEQIDLEEDTDRKSNNCNLIRESK